MHSVDKFLASVEGISPVREVRVPTRTPMKEPQRTPATCPLMAYQSEIFLWYLFENPSWQKRFGLGKKTKFTLIVTDTGRELTHLEVKDFLESYRRPEVTLGEVDDAFRGFLNTLTASV